MFSFRHEPPLYVREGRVGNPPQDGILPHMNYPSPASLKNFADSSGGVGLT